ncbi:MAG: hypothetical protein HQL77_13535 [Magnetococcales bacterium]|nr:hypothetical protein [Magnetococcales bacterium]
MKINQMLACWRPGRILPLWAMAILSGCAAMGVTRSYIHQEMQIPGPMTVAVLPFENLSNNPTAGLSVAQLFATELMTSGRFCLLEESDMRRQLASLKVDVDHLAEGSIARDVGRELLVDAVLTGSVSEFSYQHGLREEPAVGFTMQLLRVGDGVVLWRASQSLMGSGFTSRESIFYTAQQAVHATVAGLSGKLDGVRSEWLWDRLYVAPDQGGDAPYLVMNPACNDRLANRALLANRAQEMGRLRDNSSPVTKDRVKSDLEKVKGIEEDLLHQQLPPK